MLRNPIFRSALAALVFMLSLSACAGRQPIETHAALGKVVVYRNGVAYFERRAVVSDGQLKLTVPVDRVDDFLKSLQVVDAKTKQSLPVSFDTMNTGSDEAQMVIAVPGNQSRELLVSYVTDSPAWKPSYRIVLEPKDDKAELEAWAVVDNVSGEDWKQVTVGVGSTSALSFRYDLHSVREVQRETLGDENAYAMAGPMGGSPYAVAGDEAPVIGALDNSMFDQMGEHAVVAQAAAAPMEESEAMYRESNAGLQSLSGGGRSAGAVSKRRGKSADRDAATLRARPSAASAPADDGMALQRLATEINKRDGKVQIQGYARSGDGDPQNDARMRAERVRDQLVQLGVPAEKVEAEASGLVSDSQAVRVVMKTANDSKPAQ